MFTRTEKSSDGFQPLKKTYPRRLPAVAAILFAAMSLPCVVALGDGVSHASWESAGHFDTAVLTNGVFRNPEDTDARYVAELYSSTEGSMCTITVDVEIAPSNSVWVSLGNAQNPDFLRIGNEDGRWVVLAGSQIRPFGATPPPLPSVTRTHRLAIVTDTAPGRLTSTVHISVDGSRQSTASHLAPAPSVWLDAGQSPALLTHATVSLRGKGAGLRSLGYSLHVSPTLIILR